MTKWKQQLKNERGLTLVELLAVFVILAIVATIAFVAIGNVIENSKKDSFIANAKQMIESAKLYEVDGGKIEEGVATNPGVEYAELKNEGFIEPIYDPWDKKEPKEGVVTKDRDGGTYTVHLKANNGKVIEETEAEIKQKNRNDIFD